MDVEPARVGVESADALLYEGQVPAVVTEEGGAGVGGAACGDVAGFGAAGRKQVDVVVGSDVAAGGVGYEGYQRFVGGYVVAAYRPSRWTADGFNFPATGWNAVQVGLAGRIQVTVPGTVWERVPGEGRPMRGAVGIEAFFHIVPAVDVFEDAAGEVQVLTNPFRTANAGRHFGEPYRFSGFVDGEDVELRGGVVVAPADERKA